MKSLVFSGIAATAMMFALTPAGASDSFAPSAKSALSGLISPVAHGGPEGPAPMPGGMGHGMGHGPMTGGMPPVMGGGHGPMPGGMVGHHGGGHNIGGGMHRWGPRIGGRWHGGYNAPGGWNAYRPAYRGYVMPRYWVSPSFYIGNYSAYGLRAPSNGYNWYRYYDDAVLSDQRGYVYDSVPGVAWDRYEGGYAPDNGYDRQPAYGPAIRPEPQAYNWNDDSDDLAYSAPDGNKYDYQGNWQGDYVDPQARVYEGQWNGRVTRYDANDRGADPRPVRAPEAGAPYPYEPDVAYRDAPEERYSVPQGYERYEQCLRGRGLTGGAIGAVLGGVAGNRIAGPGDRLGGTILGAGLGGLAGVAIEKATNKCRKYRPYETGSRDYDRYPAPRPSYPYPQQGYQPQYQQGYQGGYYYYPQAAPVITTVTVVPGAATTTTTTTEEVTYETVYSKPRYHAVRKWKPRPKPRPRCNCTIQGS
jgi:uncharacterized protein YcfJ/Ni/Co efflux regulator RcnB